METEREVNGNIEEGQQKQRGRSVETDREVSGNREG